MALQPKQPRLSDFETERLRDLRSRLSRRAISDAALLTLGTATFQLLEQMGLAGAEPYPVESLSIPALIKTAEGANTPTLARLVATLKVYKTAQPKAWAAAVAGGAPQALITRRLVLGGREQPVESPQ
jgi:hypothetical protein